MLKAPKILISMDIEGVAGVYRPEQTQAGQAEYERARRWMTDEASAAVRGALAGGAGTVIVNDSHGHFCNLLAEQLDSRAELIQGKPRKLGMMAGVDLPDVAGVLMIGWHARAKSRGVLAHTTNSFAFSRVWLGEMEVGEVEIYAALAGELGVPVLMVSGCDVLAEELKERLPATPTTVVKWSEGNRTGRSLSPQAACKAIETAACHVVQSLHTQQPQPWKFPTDPSLRIRCQTPAMADLFALWPHVQREDNETVRIACGTVLEAVRSLNALSAMSSALR